MPFYRVRIEAEGQCQGRDGQMRRIRCEAVRTVAAPGLRHAEQRAMLRVERRLERRVQPLPYHRRRLAATHTTPCSWWQWLAGWRRRDRVQWDDSAPAAALPDAADAQPDSETDTDTRPALTAAPAEL